MNSHQIRSALTVYDLLCAILAPYIAWYFRNFFFGLIDIPPGFYFYSTSAAIATICLLWTGGVSRVAWRFFSFPDAVDAFISLALGIVVATISAFFFDRLASVPRSLPFITVFIHFSLYTGIRLVLKRFANKIDVTRIKPTYVLLVGCNQLSYVYARAVESVSRGSLRIAAALTHDPTMVGHKLRGINIISVFDQVEDSIGKLKIHGIDVSRIVISATPDEISKETLDKITRVAADRQISVNDIHLLFTEVAGETNIDDDFTIDVIELRGLYWGIKRSLDVFGATMLILLLLPLFSLTAILVRLDVGSPLLFWQVRPGRHGKMIHVYKFRTMKDSVDKSGAPVADEFRTSKIGLFLRKVRLDELPQLWNILRGDMSFIGPRPLLFVDQPDEVSQRLAIRPGISGWAQVNGGKLITPDEKNALDLWHIGHVSFGLEMKIVWMTLLVMLRGDTRREEAISEAINWLRRQTDASIKNQI
jgi:lipopolysaccharide/colanic/teichoic acid biosynthesis glycosyltransferase